MDVCDILVVDDDLGIRETLGDVLRDEGYRVRLVGDGAEALGELSRDPLPRLVLLDLSMPGLGGRALLAVRRADPRLRAVPVVVLSAGEELDLGDDVAWLRKPVDLGELLDTVALRVPPPRR